MSDEPDFSRPGPKLVGVLDDEGELTCPRCGSTDFGCTDGGDPLCSSCNASVAYPPQNVVIYHGGGCMDGFCAAWVAHGVLGDTAVYVPVQYGRRPPETPFGATVYVLDFSYPASDLMDLAEQSRQVTVLDHHLSAERELADLTYPCLSITFDMTKSGAMLAWEHFHPGEPAPEIIRYVQDRDLWAWELPDSRAFSAALKLVAFDFQCWDSVHLTLPYGAYRAGFLERGRAVVMAQDMIIKGLCDKAFTTRILGHSVPCVNSPAYQSEIGDELCRRRPEAPFAAVWFSQDMTSRVWSLRSRNGFDVSEVAKYFGGGGHAAASGFRAGLDQNIASPPVATLPITESPE